MKLSLVIVSYKVPYHLLLCLDSLERALKNISHEIFIVDNHSEDNSKLLINQHFSYVNFIANKKNVGFAKANNQAIKMAVGDYICLVNPDTIVAEDTFTTLLNKANQIEKHGILGVQMTDGTGRFLPESKVNQLTPLRAAMRLLGFSKRYFNFSIPQNQINPTYTLVGAFMFFKKMHYQKVKGLDERYFMYGEDIDISHQFMQQGWQNYYIGIADIIHFKGESTLKNSAYLNRFFQSILIYFDTYYKYPKWVKFWVHLFFSIAKPIKKMQSSKKPKLELSEQTIVFSDHKSIEKQLATNNFRKVERLSTANFLNKSIKKSLIIFDMSCITYRQAIDYMKKYHTHQNSYRFKPAKQNFLIGSDSKTSMGEIKHLIN